MSAANPLGIFASNINHKKDLSVKRIRTLVKNEAHAERILATVVAMVVAKTKEDPAEIESDLRDISRLGYKAPGYIKLVMRCIGEIEVQFSTIIPTEGANEGLESHHPGWDSRNAGEIAEAIIMAA